MQWLAPAAVASQVRLTRSELRRAHEIEDVAGGPANCGWRAEMTATTPLGFRRVQ